MTPGKKSKGEGFLRTTFLHPEHYGLRQWSGLLGGPLVFLVLLALPPPASLSQAGWRTLAVMVMMGTLWLTEAIPIPATALLPLILLPALSIANVGEAARPYAHPLIFLFMGGFMIAVAMQRWNLHRRIAFNIVRIMGTSLRGIVAGFMVATAFLSMWVSNTATTLMMVPIGVSVVLLLQSSMPEGSMEWSREVESFAAALMLGIAFGSSIGGVGTLIGTPPNAYLAAFLAEAYDLEIGFARWMLLGVPLVLAGVPITWWLLTRVVFKFRLRSVGQAQSVVRDELAKLGPISYPEGAVGTIVLLVATSWILRPLLQDWLPWPSTMVGSQSDTVIAISGVLLLFLVPVNIREGIFLLSWRDAEKLPWGVLILFGGGLSLADAIQHSNLATWIGSLTTNLGGFPLFLLILIIVLMIMLLTEFSSNIATAAAFLPVVGSVAIGMGMNPALLVVPAALAASCAFMMPVATPPNAIVFSTGYVSLPQMVKAGFFVNVLFVLLIPILFLTVGRWLLRF